MTPSFQTQKRPGRRNPTGPFSFLLADVLAEQIVQKSVQPRLCRLQPSRQLLEPLGYLLLPLDGQLGRIL